MARPRPTGFEEHRGPTTPGELEDLQEAYLKALAQRKAPLVAVADNETMLVENLVSLLTRTLDKCSKQDKVIIGLSGGSLVGLLKQVFPFLCDVDWKKVWFVFCDERFVPFGSEHSTYGAYRRTILSVEPQLGLANWITVNLTSDSVELCARDYEMNLKAILPTGSGSFDLLLLGLGLDGHTASLFPGDPAVEEKNSLVTFVKNSPKPPSERITLTLPAINSAKTVAFVVTGEEKAPVVQKILEGNDTTFPAGKVKPTSGELHWLLDIEAAKFLSQPRKATV